MSPEVLIALGITGLVFGVAGMFVAGREGFAKGLAVFAIALAVMWLVSDSDRDESKLDCVSGPGGAFDCVERP